MRLYLESQNGINCFGEALIFGVLHEELCNMKVGECWRVRVMCPWSETDFVGQITSLTESSATNKAAAVARADSDLALARDELVRRTQIKKKK